MVGLKYDEMFTEENKYCALLYEIYRTLVKQ